MHQTIIAMISTPLERSLRELNRRVPNRKEVASLIEFLKPHLDSQRSMESSLYEVGQWISTPNGGLRRAVKDVMDGLIVWSNQSAINPVPTNYTHQTILFAIKSLGADEVLGVIVDQIKAQTQIGFGSSALEIGTALICAPCPMQSTPLLTFDGHNHTAQPAHHRRTLRQALRHKLESATDMLDMETEYVEALVRLGRRVDAQSAVSAMDSIGMPIANLNSQDLMQDISLGGAGISDEDMVMHQTGLPQGTDGQFADLGGSLDLGAPGTVGGLDSVSDASAMQVDLSGPLFDPGQGLSFDMDNTARSPGQESALPFGTQQADGSVQNTEDDIFAGLDMGDMGEDDFNFT